MPRTKHTISSIHLPADILHLLIAYLPYEQRCHGMIGDRTYRARQGLFRRYYTSFSVAAGQSRGQTAVPSFSTCIYNKGKRSINIDTNKNDVRPRCVPGLSKQDNARVKKLSNSSKTMVKFVFFHCLRFPPAMSPSNARSLITSTSRRKKTARELTRQLSSMLT